MKRKAGVRARRGGGLERGGSLCPLFDLCLHMTRQEITDERRQ